MKKILGAVLILSIFPGMVHAGLLRPEHRAAVQDFIDAVKTDNPSLISKRVKFPLEWYPKEIKIETASEFITRYDEIFCNSLLDIIKNSDLDRDWSDMGWRGIMLRDGDLWLDEDGTLISILTNCTEKYASYKQIITAAEPELHESVAKYDRNMLHFETKKFKVRIDEMSEGKHRYASWGIDQDLSEKPNIVLYDAEIEYYDSGLDHSYTFKSGKYMYIVGVNVTGYYSNAPYSLTVFKGDKKLLSEEGE